MTLETDGSSTASATGADPANRSPDPQRLLCIYLSDHRAGAEAGCARAKRFAEANASGFLGGAASDVFRQIEEDVRTLDEILDRVGCRPSGWKNLAARGAELFGRLKLNGQLRGYSPLSRLIELELLIAGIVTKESLWQTLAASQEHRPQLSDFDFDALQHRAIDQRMQLESHRGATVAEAFRR